MGHMRGTTHWKLIQKGGTDENRLAWSPVRSCFWTDSSVCLGYGLGVVIRMRALELRSITGKLLVAGTLGAHEIQAFKGSV